MSYRLVRELAADGIDVAVACRVRKVSRSGYYDWRDRPPSDRDVADAWMTNTILAVHADSRCSYGSPRVHAELRLGLGLRCGRKRVARLMHQAGICGIGQRHKKNQRRRVLALDKVSLDAAVSQLQLMALVRPDGPELGG